MPFLFLERGGNELRPMESSNGLRPARVPLSRIVPKQKGLTLRQPSLIFFKRLAVSRDYRQSAESDYLQPQIALRVVRQLLTYLLRNREAHRLH